MKYYQLQVTAAVMQYIHFCLTSKFYISEMVMYMPGNIFLIRCMALVYINLVMVIVMKERGMKGNVRALVGTLSEVVKHNLDTGKMGFLMLSVQITQNSDLHMWSLYPKSLIMYR